MIGPARARSTAPRRERVLERRHWQPMQTRSSGPPPGSATQVPPAAPHAGPFSSAAQPLGAGTQRGGAGVQVGPTQLIVVPPGHVPGEVLSGQEPPSGIVTQAVQHAGTTHTSPAAQGASSQGDFRAQPPIHAAPINRSMRAIFIGSSARSGAPRAPPRCRALRPARAPRPTRAAPGSPPTAPRAGTPSSAPPEAAAPAATPPAPRPRARPRRSTPSTDRSGARPRSTPPPPPPRGPPPAPRAA